MSVVCVSWTDRKVSKTESENSAGNCAHGPRTQAAHNSHFPPRPDRDVRRFACPTTAHLMCQGLTRSAHAHTHTNPGSAIYRDLLQVGGSNAIFKHYMNKNLCLHHTQNCASVVLHDFGGVGDSDYCPFKSTSKRLALYAIISSKCTVTIDRYLCSQMKQIISLR